MIFSTAVFLTLWGILTLLNLPLTQVHAGMVLYFTTVTAVILVWVEGGTNPDPKRVVRRYMAALVLKMFLSVLLVAALLVLLPRHRAVPLALTFAVLYLAYLTFTTLRLMRRPAGT